MDSNFCLTCPCHYSDAFANCPSLPESADLVLPDSTDTLELDCDGVSSRCGDSSADSSAALSALTGNGEFGVDFHIDPSREAVLAELPSEDVPRSGLDPLSSLDHSIENDRIDPDIRFYTDTASSQRFVSKSTQKSKSKRKSKVITCYLTIFFKFNVNV